jgi:chromosomal replication initiator protein
MAWVVNVPVPAMVDAIQRAVAILFNLSLDELMQRNNARAVALPRQIAIYLVKQMTDASLPQIGNYFGGRHHTTVMHAIAKIHEQRRTDGDLDRIIDRVSREVRTGIQTS